MLFSYRHVPHDIEIFQTYLDHLVKNVWCRAQGPYSLELLQDDFRKIVEAIFYDDRCGDWLDGPIKKIDAIFQNELTPSQRSQFKTWYDSNNDIEALCRGDADKIPITYSEIAVIHEELARELKKFCNGLFSNVIYLKVVEDKLGSIDEHYQAFVEVNNQGKCPYCGYNDIKGNHNTKREAYDHFLPKGTYPFNSVNFRNLAPMCHECNSTYKLAKDPTRHIDPIKKQNTQKRRAFYSYSQADHSIEIEIQLESNSIRTLCPEEIKFQFTADSYDEEIESWCETYGIEERYKAKLCGENDGKAWVQQIVEESMNPSLTPEILLSMVYRAANNKPWSNAQFLQGPFLKACENSGIINSALI